jgi:LysM repeat protein
MSGAHIVVAGDTLSEIAQKYKLSTADLAKWNNIADPDKISIGQKIELSDHGAGVDENGNPPSQGKDQVYVVEAGDTLSSIAAKFNTSWKGIQDFNKIEDINKISVGQKLVIPDNPH